MTPAEYIAKKKTYAVALTTEQVDRLSREFREKAAWIVGQDEVHIIDSYYRAAEKIASGELTPAEARRMVREALAEAGYQAENPGSWGDLKDGTARQKLILETNVNKAAGYAYYTSMQGSDAYPAQRLVRMGHRKQPRDWQARWMQAYASLPPEEQAKALPTQMVALTDCKIWEAISRWGDPYPPFDYGSGMDVDAVDYDTAARLGLVPKLPEAETQTVANRAPEEHDCKASVRPCPYSRENAEFLQSEGGKKLHEWYTAAREHGASPMQTPEKKDIKLIKGNKKTVDRLKELEPEQEISGLILTAQQNAARHIAQHDLTPEQWGHMQETFHNWDSLNKAANGQLVFTKNINGEVCTLTATLGSKKHLVDGARKLRLVTFYTSLSQKTNFKKERKTRGARTYTGLTNVSPLREI